MEEWISTVAKAPHKDDVGRLEAKLEAPSLGVIIYID